MHSTIHKDLFRRLSVRFYLLAFSALLLALTRYSYRAKELLACWLFFCSLFAALVLVFFGAVLAGFATQYFLKWLNVANLVIPRLTVLFVEASQEAISMLGILIAGTLKAPPSSDASLDAQGAHSDLLIEAVIPSNDGVRK